MQDKNKITTKLRLSPALAGGYYLNWDEACKKGYRRMIDFRNCAHIFLKLPPPEKREHILGKVIGCWLLARGELENDDSYIIGLVIRNTFIVSVIVGFCLLIYVGILNQKSDIHFYYPVFPPVKEDLGMVGLYSFLFSKIMWIIVIAFSAFYFLLYTANIKKSGIDVFRADPLIKHQRNRTIQNKKKKYKLYFKGVILILAALFYTDAPVLAFMLFFNIEETLKNSYPYLIISYSYQVVGTVACTLVLHVCITTIYSLFYLYDEQTKK